MTDLGNSHFSCKACRFKKSQVMKKIMSSIRAPFIVCGCKNSFNLFIFVNQDNL